jgi:hypothetical protein
MTTTEPTYEFVKGVGWCPVTHKSMIFELRGVKLRITERQPLEGELWDGTIVKEVTMEARVQRYQVNNLSIQDFSPYNDRWNNCFVRTWVIERA